MHSKGYKQNEQRYNTEDDNRMYARRSIALSIYPLFRLNGSAGKKNVKSDAVKKRSASEPNRRSENGVKKKRNVDVKKKNFSSNAKLKSGSDANVNSKNSVKPNVNVKPLNESVNWRNSNSSNSRANEKVPEINTFKMMNTYQKVAEAAGDSPLNGAARKNSRGNKIIR